MNEARINLPERVGREGSDTKVTADVNDEVGRASGNSRISVAPTPSNTNAKETPKTNEREENVESEYQNLNGGVHPTPSNTAPAATIHLRPGDILLTISKDYEGNVEFRNILNKHRKNYISSTSGAQRNKIANRVVDEVESLGARFLAADGEGRLDQVTREVAVQECETALQREPVPSPLPEVTLIKTLHPRDVLLGSSLYFGDYEGNINFRAIVKKYNAGDVSQHKRDIADRIVDEIEQGGGRFLQESTKVGTWVQVSRDVAIVTCNRALQQKREPGEKSDMKIGISEVVTTTSESSARPQNVQVGNDVTGFRKSTLRPHDVLFGRGSGSFYYEGNIRFRAIILKYKNSYNGTKVRQEKADIADLIVDKIEKSGGRFLEKKEGDDAWVQVYRRVALEKTKQALRQKKDPVSSEKLLMMSDKALTENTDCSFTPSTANVDNANACPALPLPRLVSRNKNKNTSKASEETLKQSMPGWTEMPSSELVARPMSDTGSRAPDSTYNDKSKGRHSVPFPPHGFSTPPVVNVDTAGATSVLSHLMSKNKNASKTREETMSESMPGRRGPEGFNNERKAFRSTHLLPNGCSIPSTISIDNASAGRSISPLPRGSPSSTNTKRKLVAGDCEQEGERPKKRRSELWGFDNNVKAPWKKSQSINPYEPFAYW